MGHKIYITYEEANNPSTRCGEFFTGLFAGTMAFMTTIGGWLVSVFCWFGMETRLSAWLAIGLSVLAGLISGIYLARDCSKKTEEKCKTKHK